MINIISIGSCTPLDILSTDPQFDKKYKVLYKYQGSVSRTYYKPGSIALRLSEEKKLLKLEHSLVQLQIQSILKEESLLSIIKTVPADTVILVDHAYELWRYFHNGSEMFDIRASYARIANFFPDWFNQEIKNHSKRFDEGTLSTARKQYEYINDFICQLDRLPNPVIVFGNTFTSNCYIPKTKTVGKILPMYYRSIPIGKNWFHHDDMMAYQYTEKIVQNFYKNLDKEMPDNVIRFNIDLENVYSDPNHPNGPHPAHYHYTCRQMLLSSLNETIRQAMIPTNHLVFDSGIEPLTSTMSM